MKAIPATNLKFSSESAEVPELSALEFVISMKVTQDDAQGGGQTIETLYRALQECIAAVQLDGVILSLIDPAANCAKERAFSLGAEYGLSRKMMASLSILLRADFKTETDFWKKGASLAAIIDTLEQFAEQHSKEKGVLVNLTQGVIPKEQDAVGVD